MTTLSSHEPTSRKAPSSTDELGASVIKKFRDQIHTLGGVWIFLGCLAAALGVYLSTATPSPMLARANFPLSVAFFIGVGGTWVTLGVLAFLKKMWAIKVGLLLSYFFLIGNVLSWLDQASVPGNKASPSGFGLVFGIAIILQCHRVISWANQMQKAGVPLTLRQTTT